MSSRAELDFLSSFERYLNIITKCSGEDIHKLNLIRKCNNNLIAAWVECHREGFLTRLVQMRDLKLLGLVVPDLDLARRAGYNQCFSQTNIQASYSNHVERADDWFNLVCLFNFELNFLFNLPPDLNLLKLVRFRCIVHKILSVGNGEVFNIITAPSRSVFYFLH